VNSHREDSAEQFQFALHCSLGSLFAKPSDPIASRRLEALDIGRRDFIKTFSAEILLEHLHPPDVGFPRLLVGFRPRKICSINIIREPGRAFLFAVLSFKDLLPKVRFGQESLSPQADTLAGKFRAPFVLCCSSWQLHCAVSLRDLQSF